MEPIELTNEEAIAIEENATRLSEEIIVVLAKHVRSRMEKGTPRMHIACEIGSAIGCAIPSYVVGAFIVEKMDGSFTEYVEMIKGMRDTVEKATEEYAMQLLKDRDNAKE